MRRSCQEALHSVCSLFKTNVYYKIKIHANNVISVFYHSGSAFAQVLRRENFSYKISNWSGVMRKYKPAPRHTLQDSLEASMFPDIPEQDMRLPNNRGQWRSTLSLASETETLDVTGGLLEDRQFSMLRTGNYDPSTYMDGWVTL
jgi:hypothetical protein